MEKLVRKTKSEFKAKDNEIAKLTETSSTLEKQVMVLKEDIQRHTGEVTVANKSLSAMQAVSQASTDKISKVENELVAKVAELTNTKNALEQAWTEAKSVKRILNEHKATIDDLQRQLGEGHTALQETDSSVRDMESRESMLRATTSQLQDTLQRQMNESTAREERLREEVGEMRKRWQEAIVSREALSTDMNATTQPLMKQIGHLQETLRAKSESWSTVESTLSERALRAESAYEVAEQKKILAEEQATLLKHQLAKIQLLYDDCSEKLRQAIDVQNTLRASEGGLKTALEEVQTKVNAYDIERSNLQNSTRELEIRYEKELFEEKALYEQAVREHRGAQNALQDTCGDLRAQLDVMRSDRKRLTHPLGVLSGMNTPITATRAERGGDREGGRRARNGGSMSVESKNYEESIAMQLDFGKSNRKGERGGNSSPDHDLADISLLDSDGPDDGHNKSNEGDMVYGVNRNRKSFVQEVGTGVSCYLPLSLLL